MAGVTEPKWSDGVPIRHGQRGQAKGPSAKLVRVRGVNRDAITYQEIESRRHHTVTLEQFTRRFTRY